MSIKLRILCVISALCFLGSVACFSGYAAEFFDRPSGDEDVPADPGYVEPEPVYPDPEPVVPNPEPVDPDPGNVSVDPIYSDPGTVSVDPVDPGNEDPGSVVSHESDPGTVSVDPGNEDPTSSNSVTVSDLISDGNYPQDNSSSIDYTSEYNQYIENTNQAKYDDNYLYIPSYTAPTEKLIETSSKIVDTDELTAEDWARIMLDLDDGNISNDGSKTFSFIKDNEEEGDTSIEWMLYLGVALIVLSIFTVIFVIISTSKANEKLNYA